MQERELRIEELSRPVGIMDYPIYLVDEDIEELTNGVDYLSYYDNSTDFDYCYDDRFNRKEAI